MITYHPIKFGCKKISSSEDMKETAISDYMSPHGDPDLEDSKTNLLAWHSGPWRCITIPSLVTKGSAVEEISSRWTFTGILNLSCDLDLDHNRAIQSFHKKPRLWWCATKPVLVAKGSAVQKTYYKVILWLYDPSSWDFTVLAVAYTGSCVGCRNLGHPAVHAS